MWRFVKDIFDVKNIFGMQRTPIPVPYPEDETVLRSTGTNVQYIPYITSGQNWKITYTIGGVTYIDEYDDSSSGTNHSIAIDEGTDVIITGGIYRITCGYNVSFLAVSNTIQEITIDAAVETLDLRNATAFNTFGYITDNVRVLYALATSTILSSRCIGVINNSTVNDGILWIDRTQAHAAAVVAAATAKGWQIYDL